MAGEPTLNSGDSGDWVTYLQQLLEHIGVGTGFVAGVFDEITLAAVRVAQQQFSLSPTGCCDEGTWAAIVARAHGGAAAAEGQAPNDIAVSMQDEVAAPDEQIALTELDELPSHAQAVS